MSITPVKTRFAPSPTGLLHLGNARTALFSALLARREGGTFLLRIEDTDAQRSREEFVLALAEDLDWLGIPGDEGPARDGGSGPYRQSERTAVYEAFYTRLEQGGHVYPCFCSAAELEMSRKAQRSAAQAPRYSGKCARLSAEEVATKRAAGLPATLRFRVPNDRTIVFDDLVRGEQRFAGADIGDFIIRRADGSPAFFFCNAVDDALMGVTHVLRGEDHLTNTPRQLLLLEALALPLPRYGHIALIVGSDGAPLSKRHGSRSLCDLRREGYFPLAVANYLARLGHTYADDLLLPLESLAAAFDLARLGRAPARYDAHQLLHWQHQVLAVADLGALWDWMEPAAGDLVPVPLRAAFVEAVRGNISFPDHARRWAERLFTDPLELDPAARAAIAEAGPGFFRAAIAAAEAHGTEFKPFADAVKAATGAKGKTLFMPLRAALTGEAGGPEMARVLPLIGAERARRRLQACIADD